MSTPLPTSPATPEGSLAAAFVREAARLLLDVHLPRLERAVETLPAGDATWRPHPQVLDVATILRHLEGNVRQWILAGLAGEPDGRERGLEFAPAEPERRSAQELAAALRRTVERAASAIEKLDEAALRRSTTIQGFATDGLAAVLHVVEHFSWHTGQAVWIAKARAGADHGLAFYDSAALNRPRV